MKKYHDKNLHNNNIYTLKHTQEVIYKPKAFKVDMTMTTICDKHVYGSVNKN